jgi:hypothetical protein
LGRFIDIGLKTRIKHKGKGVVMMSVLMAAGLLFPVISGSNLSGRNMTLPRDFEGRLNVVIVAFFREQQLLVDSWSPILRELRKKHADLHVYELPTISRGYIWMKWIIDNGMRSGIKDPDTRDHTITLFTDTGKFRKELDLPTDRTIYLLLVDSKGVVVWKTAGSMTDAGAKSLMEKVDKLSGS